MTLLQFIEDLRTQELYDQADRLEEVVANLSSVELCLSCKEPGECYMLDEVGERDAPGIVEQTQYMRCPQGHEWQVIRRMATNVRNLSQSVSAMRELVTLVQHPDPKVRRAGLDRWGAKWIVTLEGETRVSSVDLRDVTDPDQLIHMKNAEVFHGLVRMLADDGVRHGVLQILDHGHVDDAQVYTTRLQMVRLI